MKLLSETISFQLNKPIGMSKDLYWYIYGDFGKYYWETVFVTPVMNRIGHEAN